MFKDFKDSFKYYKSKSPPPNLDNVLDFDNVESFSEKVKNVQITSTNDGRAFLLNPLSTWRVFELIDHPGLVFIKNPFTSIGQRYWTARCLRDYSRKPNKTNLDTLNVVAENKEWWEMCQNNSNKLLMNKLRWVTLGYHHDWDTKIYTEENKGDFPNDLHELSNFIAETLGCNNFNAEAAIVNYYHMDSTLSGHTDHSEKDLEAPLLSLSFGQTAIFLIGGPDKDDPTSALFLRSGDIVVMSKESRLCYHGVPKILQMDSRFWDTYSDQNEYPSSKYSKEIVAICDDEKSWKPFGDYLNHSRINLNVRQVLKRGQKRLCEDKT